MTEDEDLVHDLVVIDEVVDETLAQARRIDRNGVACDACTDPACARRQPESES